MACALDRVWFQIQDWERSAPLPGAPRDAWMHAGMGILLQDDWRAACDSQLTTLTQQARLHFLLYTRTAAMAAAAGAYAEALAAFVAEDEATRMAAGFAQVLSGAPDALQRGEAALWTLTLGSAGVCAQQAREVLRQVQAHWAAVQACLDRLCAEFSRTLTQLRFAARGLASLLAACNLL